MPVFNYPKKEVNVKVVYYGPGLSGKTSNLQKIHDGIKPDYRGKLVSLATQTDRTLFFDFMPLELGSLGGYKIRLHLYTVPGQVHYNATRKLVLKGVDGVVFVADSQRTMKDANIESVLNLEKNLQSYGKSLSSIPHVIQANKRDLEDLIPLEEIDSLLNHHGALMTEAVASEGQGVLETLTEIVRMVLKALRDQFKIEQAEPGKAVTMSGEDEGGAGHAEEKTGAPATGEAAKAGSTAEGTIAADPQGADEAGSTEPVPVPEPAPAPEPADIPRGDGEGSHYMPDAQAPPLTGEKDPAGGQVIRVCVPVGDMGTLELAISIDARLVEAGDSRPLRLEVEAAAPVPSTGTGASGEAAEMAGVTADPEEAEELRTGEPASAEEGLPPLGEESSSDRELPPLQETSMEPLGAPLDGQETVSLQIPDLPGRDHDAAGKDEDRQAARTSVPAPGSQYDPTLDAPDESSGDDAHDALELEFPEPRTEEDPPKRKGLFGRLRRAKR